MSLHKAPCLSPTTQSLISTLTLAENPNSSYYGQEYFLPSFTSSSRCLEPESTMGGKPTSVLTVMWVLVAITFLFMALRLFTRIRIIDQLGPDDHIYTLSGVSFGSLSPVLAFSSDGIVMSVASYPRACSHCPQKPLTFFIRHLFIPKVDWGQSKDPDFSTSSLEFHYQSVDFE